MNRTSSHFHSPVQNKGNAHVPFLYFFNFILILIFSSNIIVRRQCHLHTHCQYTCKVSSHVRMLWMTTLKCRKNTLSAHVTVSSCSISKLNHDCLTELCFNRCYLTKLTSCDFIQMKLYLIIMVRTVKYRIV